MIRLKNTGNRARIGGIQPEMVFAVLVVESVVQEHELGYDTVITSCTESSKYRRKGSRHIPGFAIDIRTKHLTSANKNKLTENVTEALGPDYDVVLERTHLHIEYDPQPLEHPSDSKTT